MTAATYYSSPAEVIAYVGLQAADFGFTDTYGEGGVTAQSQLEDMVEVWLVAIKNYIDRSRNRDYAAEEEVSGGPEIPPGIHNIAMRAASNQAAVLILRRQTPIVKLDSFKSDFMLKLVDDTVWSKALKDDLALFPAKPRLRMARMRSEADQEEEEAEAAAEEEDEDEPV